MAAIGDENVGRAPALPLTEWSSADAATPFQEHPVISRSSRPRGRKAARRSRETATRPRARSAPKEGPPSRHSLARGRVAFIIRLAVAQVSIETADGVDYPDGMSDQEIARFRAQAEECRQQAEKAISPLDKEAWLRVAGEWIKLAQETERRLRGRE